MPLFEIALFIAKPAAGAIIGYGAKKAAELGDDKFLKPGKLQKSLVAATSRAIAEFERANPRYKDAFNADVLHQVVGNELAQLLIPGREVNPETIAVALAKLFPATKQTEFSRPAALLVESIAKQMAIEPLLREIASLRLLLKGDDALARIEAMLPSKDIDAIELKLIAASKAAVDQWSKSSPLLAGASIARRLSISAAQPQKTVAVEGLVNTLPPGSGYVIQGEPGMGKSTLLLEMARLLLDGESQYIPIRVSLPEWSESGQDIADHVLKAPVFAEVHNVEFLRLAGFGRIAFLLDGWNEVADDKVRATHLKLIKLFREYSGCTFIIASRSGVTPPDITGGRDVELERLSRDEQLALAKLFGDSGVERLRRLTQNHRLRDVLRNPLFLTLVLNLDANNEPQSREGILAAIVAQAKTQKDRQALIEAQTGAFDGNYMRALAFGMSAAGTSVTTGSLARSTLVDVSTTLINDKQVIAAADPGKILHAFCAADLLIQSPAGDTFRFAHHLIQEWYASLGLEQELIQADAAGDLQQFLRAYVNAMQWEEAILLMAERMSRDEARRPVLGRLVVAMLGVDPIFAAETVQRSDPELWPLVEKNFLDLYAAWSPTSPVLAYSMASTTGKPAFAQVIWDAIASPDDRVRHKALHSTDNFPVEMFGADELVRRALALPDEAKTGLLYQLCHGSGVLGMQVATEIALASSQEIKLEAIDRLDYTGHDDGVQRLIDSLDAEGLKKVRLREGDNVNAEQREKLAASAMQLLDDNADAALHAARWSSLPELYLLDPKAAQARAVPLLKSMLVQKSQNIEQLQVVCDIAAGVDPEATAELLVSILCTGKGLQSGLERYLVPTEKGRAALMACIQSAAKLDHWQAQSIAPMLKADDWLQLLEAELGTIMAERRKLSNIDELLAAANPGEVFSAILRLPQLQDPKKIYWLCYWIRRAASERRGEDADRRVDLVRMDDASQAKFLALFESWMPIAEAVTTYRGDMWTTLMQAIAKAVGLTGMPLMRRLIAHEQGRAALATQQRKSGKNSPDRLDDVVMGYSNQYVNALEQLNHPHAEKVLVELLDDDEFASDAAFALARIVGPPPPGGSFGHYSVEDFKAGIALRGKPPKTAHPHIAAIIEKLRAIGPDSADERKSVAVSFACALSMCDIGDEAPLVFRRLAFAKPSYRIAATYLLMALRGHVLPSAPVIAHFNATLAELQAKKWHQPDDWSVLQKWLELVLLTDMPEATLECAQKLPKEAYGAGRADSIIRTIGVSGAQNALELLKFIGPQLPAWDRLLREWYFALADIGTEEAGETLIKVALSGGVKASQDGVSAALARFARGSDAARAALAAALPNAQSVEAKSVLATAIAEMRDEDLLVAALDMLDDNDQVSPLSRAIRDICWRGENEQGWGTMTPHSANAVRKRLFAMLSDPARGKAARKMLNRIDDERLTGGRPKTEHRHPDIETGKPWPPEAAGVISG